MKHCMKISSLMLLSLFVVSFQNCGPGFMAAEEAASSDGTMEFLSYPYKAKPKFYSSIALYKLDSATPGIISLRVIASASHPSDSAATAYVLSVRGPDGAIVCPTQEGSVQPGSTSIQMDCASSRNPSELIVELALASGSDSETVQKEY